MSADLDLLWPVDRLYESVQRLVRAAGLSRSRIDVPRVQIDIENIESSIERAAQLVEVESMSAMLDYNRFAEDLKGLAPALIRVDNEGGVFFLAVLSCKKKHAIVVDPSGRERRVGTALLRHLMGSSAESPYEPFVQTVLSTVEPTHRERERIEQALLGKFLEKQKFGNVWVLRGFSGHGLLHQIRTSGLWRRVGVVIALYLLQSLLMAFSWWVVGKNALEGKLELGALIAWGLLLVTNVIVTATASWWQGVLLLGINGLYKKKILHGATKLAPEQIKHLGSGQLLGRVIETESLDSLAISAGMNAIMALVDMATVIGVFFLIPGATLLSLLYLFWIGVTAVQGWRLYQQQKKWTEIRIEMTNNIVEGLLGRRTRIAQEETTIWHDREDAELERYFEESTKLDRRQAAYGVVVHRGWLCLAMVSLIPNLVVSSGSFGAIAAMLGGILMSFKGLGTFAESIQSVASVLISWSQAKLLYRASAIKEVKGLPEIIEMEKKEARRKRDKGDAILEGSDLRFKYEDRNEMLLDNASITIRKGDRILLEGESGCGKTTLASVLAGLRSPLGGVILLGGFDIKTLGVKEWNKRVAYAPQFKDNHIFTGTFAFNLLMGRRWPPSADDLAEAEEVCQELGLGPLIDKMPGRIHQVVGETGWKLSHGEQSRIYLARTLLQDADVIILDESFGALDPATMKRCMDTVFARAPALITIAHP